MKEFSIRTFLSGLSRQVLLCFLLISLIPMSIISLISYQSARDQLYENTVRSLADLSSVNTRLISTNFKRIVIDLGQEATRKSNSLFLTVLSDSFRNSVKPLTEFVRSYTWATLVERDAEALKTFKETYSYYDIFLIDRDGNILFTLKRESDLGENLFTSELKETLFAKAARKALNYGRTVFSDLEIYSPSGNIMAGFLSSPLKNEKGETLGLIALQVSGEKLEQLVAHNSGFGRTGRRYLIGADLRLRTPGALGEDLPALDTAVKTKNTAKWHREHITKTSNEDAHGEQVFSYAGPTGKSVLGVHTNVDIGDVNWGFIAEIDEDEALGPSRKLAKLTLLLMCLMFIVILLIALPLTRSIVRPIVEISRALTRVGEGDINQYIDLDSKHELGTLIHGFNAMILSLRDSEKATLTHRWLQDGINQIKDNMQGEQALPDLTRNIITFLCHYIEAEIGAFYVVEGESIKLMGCYAFQPRKGFLREFALGNGMVGQAALEKKTLVFSDIPDDYIAISSGLGETRPRVITVTPVIWNNEVLALLEFGSMTQFSNLHETLIEMAVPSIAVAVQTSLSRDRTQNLLEQTQKQAEKLQEREEELRDTNNLLKQQAKELKLSEETLLNNHSQLEERNKRLKTQQELLEKRAEALALSSKYKSEFLANMSHELRTPLNSILILAQMLGENRTGNLSEKQIEFAQTIHGSGNDLLSLINDILDLSKVEAGKMSINIETVHLNTFILAMEHKFRHVAEEKGISFKTDSKDAPTQWESDPQKLNQIIKNLVSNAIRFTEKGEVTLKVGPVESRYRLNTPGLTHETVLAIAVKDTGIGIVQEKRKVIFEAFQQADGTINRKYGGTGLGLSISRELSRLLGGEIQVESESGKGSTFTVFIPNSLKQMPENNNDVVPDGSAQSNTTPHEDAETSMELDETEVDHVTSVHLFKDKSFSGVPDDRIELKEGDRSILIIEDDAPFAKIVAEAARGRGFKILVADSGETGLHFADYYQPSGIVLDVKLPGMDGHQVFQRLKESSTTRHIPVHFLSAAENSPNTTKNGAIGFLTKPVTLTDIERAFEHIERIIDRPVKRLLLVENNPEQIKLLNDLLGNGDIEIITATTGEEAKELLENDQLDCLVLDLALSDISGTELLETIRTSERLKQLPVIIYTAKDLEPKERAALDRYARSIIIKDARSGEKLLADTTLFLHRVEADLPQKQRQVLRMLYKSESVIEGRKLLIVDDDMRNVYALSEYLQEKKMDIIVATNGIESLKKLKANPDTAIVLMDIMMPDMNGYEAMREIRKQEQFKTLPIVALTAKAMKGDRAQCIAAGASDYLVKPVNMEKLLSVMRVWLYR